MASLTFDPSARFARWVRGPVDATGAVPAALADRVVARMGDDTLTVGDLARRSARLAGALTDRGVRPGDRVVVQLDTGFDLIVALVANLRAGFVHVPLSTRYGAHETRFVLDDCAARVHLLDPSCEALRGELADDGVDRPTFDALAVPSEPPTIDRPVAPEAPALQIYTSGTTGRPKGVIHTGVSITAGIGALTDLWQFGPSDKMALALPLFHVHGLCIGVFGSLLQGVQMRLIRRFDPAAVIDAIAGGATIFMGVPTMYARLLKHLAAHPSDGARLAGARLFTSGSAALPEAHHVAFEAATGHRILERYGMSETMLTLSNPYDAERRPGAVGFPVGDTRIRVVDESDVPVPTGETGELQVRGSSVMAGYHARPDATADAFVDGWFRTGDVVRVDEDGYVHIVGRRSADILKVGGYKVSAREIEDAIRELDGVDEIAVVGEPDAEWGQRIVAALVVASGTRDDWAARIASHLDGRLARHKHPRAIELVDALPRNALGKVQKHAIVRERLRDRVGRLVCRRATIDEIIPVRHAVLRPGRPLETAHFSGDDHAETVHYGAFDGDTCVGCVTLMSAPHDGTPARQLRGMATVDWLQGLGAGGRLVAHAEADDATHYGDRPLWCNARLRAVPFYARHGWVVDSEAFDIPKIGPHHRMMKRR